MPQGLGPPDAARSADERFGRMFPFLPVRELSPAAVDALVGVLTDRSGEFQFNPRIPAGYTYLGQFIDHDLTFDATSQLRAANDRPLVNFRTPRLDLDSLYGAGPRDQPYLYDWGDVLADRGVKLLVGSSPGKDGATIDDLPRNAQGRALIGDPRNDENLLVSQLQLLFVKLHNTIVDEVRRDEQLEGLELFRRAQQVVRRHYQWIVVHDFLRKAVGRALATRLLETAVDGASFDGSVAGRAGDAFMPLEFSGAAFRFGHSMVRPSYAMNTTGHEAAASIFARPADRDSLAGFRPLPPQFEIDWRLFFALSRDVVQQDSMAIDPVVVPALFELPAAVQIEGVKELPRLNILRARALGLPAGPDVARAMGRDPLTTTELGLDDVRPAAVRTELLEGAPLWYYILCEAALPDPGPAGMRLGEIGGRIVGEVLVALMRADPDSYLHEPGWVPTLPCATAGDFTMPDLVRFVHAEFRHV